MLQPKASNSRIGLRRITARLLLGLVPVKKMENLSHFRYFESVAVSQLPNR